MDLTAEEQLKQLLQVQTFLRQWEQTAESAQEAWVPRYYQGPIARLIEQVYYLYYMDKGTYRQRQWALQTQVYLDSKITQTIEMIVLTAGGIGATALLLAKTGGGAGLLPRAGRGPAPPRFADPMGMQEESTGLNTQVSQPTLPQGEPRVNFITPMEKMQAESWDPEAIEGDSYDRNLDQESSAPPDLTFAAPEWGNDGRLKGAF